MSEVAVAAASTPPVGKPRRVLVIILLSIITFGIYGLVWIYKTFEEMKEYSGKGVGGWVGVILDIVIGFVIPFLMGLRSWQALQRRRQGEPRLGLGPAAGFFFRSSAASFGYARRSGQ